MKKFQSVYVLLNALINVPMVGFFNKEINFLETDDYVDAGPSELIKDRKRKILQDTLFLIKKLIKINNGILLISLIFSGIFVNFNVYNLNPDFATSEDNGYFANMVIICLYILWVSQSHYAYYFA